MRESLSQYVNRFMRQKGLSLRAVTQRSGSSIEPSYISRILSGNITNITTDKLLSLARGLDVDVLELCAVIYRREYSTEGMRSLSDNPDMAEMLDNLIRLTGEERRAVLEMTRHLIKDKKA
jgi:transcriptional regulator with XRE-family HTH domain